MLLNFSANTASFEFFSTPPFFQNRVETSEKKERTKSKIKTSRRHYTTAVVCLEKMKHTGLQKSLKR